MGVDDVPMCNKGFDVVLGYFILCCSCRLMRYCSVIDYGSFFDVDDDPDYTFEVLMVFMMLLAECERPIP